MDLHNVYTFAWFKGTNEKRFNSVYNPPTNKKIIIYFQDFVIKSENHSTLNKSISETLKGKVSKGKGLRKSNIYFLPIQ